MKKFFDFEVGLMNWFVGVIIVCWVFFYALWMFIWGFSKQEKKDNGGWV